MPRYMLLPLALNILVIVLLGLQAGVHAAGIALATGAFGLGLGVVMEQTRSEP